MPAKTVTVPLVPDLGEFLDSESPADALARYSGYLSDTARALRRVAHLLDGQAVRAWVRDGALTIRGEYDAVIVLVRQQLAAEVETEDE
jgi:hypothetical protein